MGPYFFGFSEEKEKFYLDKYVLAIKPRPTANETEALELYVREGIITLDKSEKIIFYAKFYDKMNKIGAKVIDECIKNSPYLECRCPKGHVLYLIPNINFSKRNLCDICSNKIPVISELKFYGKIKKIGYKIVGKFTNEYTEVECISLLGVFIKIKPSLLKSNHELLKTNQELYIKYNFSYGEQMTFRVLKKNFSNLYVQVGHPFIRKLRFDFKFIYENKIIYVEYDGMQHQEGTSYFYWSSQDFMESRQRDLLKNYVCLHSPNTVLLRLDHRWIDQKRSDEELEQYILDSINTDQKLIADPEMYDWINDIPSNETLQKYIIGDFRAGTNKNDKINKKEREIIRRKIRVVVNE